jgi:6,7-dimethyl-8-ribityllumazine synthase
MSSVHKNLDNFRTDGLRPVTGKRVAVITAEWNEEVTFAMRDGAVAFLKQYGFDDSNLLVHQVPGSFELVYGAAHLLEKENVDGVIVIGCVIQGETPHFTFISQAVATGIAELNVRSGKPVIFGVLTTLNQEQALDRTGGKHGNKGTEAAATLVKMLNFNVLES